MKKYLVLLASLLIQMCMGATYAWAVFVQPLKNLTGLKQGTLQIPFTVFYIAFPLTLLFSNSIAQKLGKVKSCIAGALLFGGGWMLAQLGSFHFIFVIIGIGILSAIGVGIVYLIPVTVGLLWFPKNKGLVTGFTVAGFGGGAALISQIAGHGMELYQLTPYQMFVYFGFVFLILISIGGLFMREPENVKKIVIKPLPLKSIINQKLFFILYLAMFTGLAAGLSVNANLKELNAAANIETGILAVAFFAVGNALGRIIWGAIFDKGRSEIVIAFNLVFQAGLLMILSQIILLPFGLQTLAFVTGFNYGGVLVLYASTIARVWGSHRVHQVYGLLFSVHFLATFAPLLTGYVYDFTGSFTLPFWLLGTTLIIAAIIVLKNRIIFENQITLK